MTDYPTYAEYELGIRPRPFRLGAPEDPAGGEPPAKTAGGLATGVILGIIFGGLYLAASDAIGRST